MFSVSSLKVESSDGENFILLEGFTYTRPNGDVIQVPSGAQSDGASTPKVIWDIIPPFGLYWMPAYLHDYLYRETQLPKDVCDTIFYEAMVDTKTPEFEREIIYKAVSIAG